MKLTYIWKSLLDDNNDDSDINEREEDPIIHKLEPPTNQFETVPSTSKDNNFLNIKKEKVILWTDEQKKVSIDFFENHIEHKPPKRNDVICIKKQRLIKNQSICIKFIHDYSKFGNAGKP